MTAAKKIRVAVWGAKGRMGQEITKILKADGHVEVVENFSTKDKSNPDVVIDFSSPQGTADIVSWSLESKVPLVIGTTGLSEKHDEAVSVLAKKVPVLRDSNMGVGIHAMIKSLETFSKVFGKADIGIEEIHHIHKKDAPSGTAKLLKKSLQSILPKTVIVPEPVSLRGGEVFGVHKVYFFAESEWVCFEHQATGRDVFARGAVRGATWIVGKGAGLYSMKDVLEFS